MSYYQRGCTEAETLEGRSKSSNQILEYEDVLVGIRVLVGVSLVLSMRG